jgi:hypothetical protein
MMRTMSYEYSRASLRPLMDMYWSSKGWRRPAVPPNSEERAKAEADGIMFANDDVSDHDQWVARARAAASRLEQFTVIEAFLASLTSRRLDLRSALCSYVVARIMPEHRFKVLAGANACSVCGQYSRIGTDLNVLNFERFKWGGVRKLHVEYVAFDLEQFEKAPKLTATKDDQRLWRDIIRTIDDSDGSTTATRLATMLRPLPGSRDERANLVGTLGICSVLETEHHHGFLDDWVDASDRELPNRHFIDDPYPVCWWTGRDGINHDALKELSLNVP